MHSRLIAVMPVDSGRQGGRDGNQGIKTAGSRQQILVITLGSLAEPKTQRGPKRTFDRTDSMSSCCSLLADDYSLLLPEVENNEPRRELGVRKMFFTLHERLCFQEVGSHVPIEKST